MLLKLLLVMFISGLAPLTIYDFQKAAPADDWYTVNDGVMGGISSSEIEVNQEGHGVFSGTVRLENNGGFASARHRVSLKGVQQYKRVALRVKGDGKAYQFRLKKNPSDPQSYISTFETSGAWQTIELPLKDLYPGWRGRKLYMPNFEADVVGEITILIANKRAEDFRLEIDWIRLE